MANTKTYSRLNNLHWNDELINQVIEYKQIPNNEGPIPDTVKNSYQWRNRWREFYLNDDGKLIYRTLDLEVATDENRNDILRQLYDDALTGVGVGLKSFYYTVRNKYLNIFRHYCVDFLRDQKVYQMTRTMEHKINKPILSEQPNERWSIDLVDMGRYKGNNIKTGIY